MVSGLDFARAPCRPPLTARKKGFGYENAIRRASSQLPTGVCYIERIESIINQIQTKYAYFTRRHIAKVINISIFC